MANRRMFSLNIVNSDCFLSLPISAQALYFHLGMHTDDRGYIANGRSIIKMIGATIGDLEVLVQKEFILVRNDYLILQKHFCVNNYIQKDRFHETQFIEDLKRLYFDSNNCYCENKKESYTKCIQPVYVTDTEVRSGQVRLSKVKIIEEYSNENLEKIEKILIHLKDLDFIDNEKDIAIYKNEISQLLKTYSFEKVDNAILKFHMNLINIDLLTINNKFEYFKSSMKNNLQKN
ncbi:MAG: hypothetical protein RSB77_07580 [Bacilli bacterium]